MAVETCIIQPLPHLGALGPLHAPARVMDSDPLSLGWVVLFAGRRIVGPRHNSLDGQKGKEN